MRATAPMFVVFVTALVAGPSPGTVAAVSPSIESCVIEATQTAAASLQSRAALDSLYERYLGDAFARQAAKPGNWDKFSAEEKAQQRAWAKQRTLAAAPRFLQYASAEIEVQRQAGRTVYGKAKARGQGSTSLAWYLAGGCRFYDLSAGGYRLSQLVGSYRQANKKK